MVKNVSCIQINFLFLFFVGKDGRKIGGGSDAAKTANPTSSPSKWPGVRLLLSLLATENRDNSTKLRILLSEACVAVYLSLLALAWSNSQPNQLYRLVVNSLHSGMWGKVFGGGLRSAVQQTGGQCVRPQPVYSVDDAVFVSFCRFKQKGKISKQIEGKTVKPQLELMMHCECEARH